MNRLRDTEEAGGRGIRKIILTWKAIGVIVAVLLILAAAIGIGRAFMSESKTTKIRFEDIGDLATQSAYCTEVHATKSSRELFGITILFTQSKIYSYDVIIKAGLDFAQIQWEEKGYVLEVRLPEIRILSSEIEMDSFKPYHEDESIFHQIPLEENNSALAGVMDSAKENTIANGLQENPRINAEDILTGFFANQYDLDEYGITFVNQ